MLTAPSDQSLLLSKHYTSSIFCIILENLNQEKELGFSKVTWKMVTQIQDIPEQWTLPTFSQDCADNVGVCFSMGLPAFHAFSRLKAP